MNTVVSTTDASELDTMGAMYLNHGPTRARLVRRRRGRTSAVSQAVLALCSVAWYGFPTGMAARRIRGWFESKGVSTSRVSPPGPLSLPLSHSHTLTHTYHERWRRRWNILMSVSWLAANATAEASAMRGLDEKTLSGAPTAMPAHTTACAAECPYVLHTHWRFRPCSGNKLDT